VLIECARRKIRFKQFRCEDRLRGCSFILLRKLKNLQGTTGHGLLDERRHKDFRSLALRGMTTIIYSSSHLETFPRECDGCAESNQQESGAGCDQSAEEVYGIVVQQVSPFQQSAQEAVRDHANHRGKD